MIFSLLRRVYGSFTEIGVISYTILSRWYEMQHYLMKEIADLLIPRFITQEYPVIVDSIFSEYRVNMKEFQDGWNSACTNPDWQLSTIDENT